ncbi:TonB-dependent receptor plug domain-containing protein [Sphingorhabdus sp.]|uniref:TonB-dependent receptor plug domain-containing protein n=1 Tax=Sphingorhabdus sp. TaxID=1902408 RepID=UPI00391C3E14
MAFARQARSILTATLGTTLLIICAEGAQAQSLDDLRQMSIEELSDVNVSSVFKTDGKLSEAPAAIYVISQAEIARSGAQTIPEALRLAPNLQVAQTAASRYTVTARGMSGNEIAQNFPNKLLILIDGRSVYSPLFSGVYWDAQDVLLSDIDRIEVISGPGSTLWGANAVTGVINIITRSATETLGALADIAVGNEEKAVGLRYGGTLGPDVTYRFYTKAFSIDETQTAAHIGAGDGWDRVQGGFRADWNAAPDDRITFQGDIFKAKINQTTLDDQTVRGSNLLARWTRTKGNGELQLQAYYDRLTRRNEAEGIDLGIENYDLDAQQSMALGDHALVIGGGLRISKFETNPTGGLAFSPAARTLKLGNIFAQDTFSLSPAFKATLGIKLENGPYTGTAFMPSLRLAWQMDPNAMVWAAASRAIRSPTPFDRDVVETVGSTLFLVGNPNYRTEKVTAFELGTRVQPSPNMSFSVSTFYNEYDDLRTIELTPVTFLPLIWGNNIKGHTYGLEAWADLKITAWWRFSAHYGLLLGDFRFKPGASQLLGLSQVRNDPKHNASLRSSMNIGSSITVDADLRHVSERPEPRVEAYTELNGRLGWRVSDTLQFFVSGANLLHKSHYEYAAPRSNRIPRRVLVGLQWVH